MSTPNSEELDLHKCSDLVSQIERCNDTVLKAKLSKSYNDLVSEFSQSRLERIDNVISQIEKISQLIDKNCSKFENTLASKIPPITERYGTETELKRNNQSSPLPPILPLDLKVPIFQQAFEKISAPYVSDITNIKNKYNLQKDLLEKRITVSKNLIWSQYYKQKQDLKEARITQLSAELQDLQDEFDGHCQSKLRRINDLNYRKTRPHYKNVNDVHKKLTNKYEKNLKYKHKILKSQLANLPVIDRLSDSDIDTDLELMKFWQDKQDDLYRVAKQHKILEARKSVQRQLNDSAKKIKEMIEKQEEINKKSQLDFMREQEDLINLSNSRSPFPMPGALDQIPFNPMFFMPPFMPPSFIPPPPMQLMEEQYPQPQQIPVQVKPELPKRQNVPEHYFASDWEDIRRKSKLRQKPTPKKAKKDAAEKVSKTPEWVTEERSEGVFRIIEHDPKKSVSEPTDKEDNKVKPGVTRLLSNAAPVGEITTIKDIIAMKDKERLNNNYKRYYNSQQQ